MPLTYFDLLIRKKIFLLLSHGWVLTTISFKTMRCVRDLDHVFFLKNHPIDPFFDDDDLMWCFDFLLFFFNFITFS